VYGGLHAPRGLPDAGALVAVARGFTPRVAADAPTPVLLDLAGLGRLWPSPHALGQALLDAAAARAIEAQAALAFTRQAALVLARARPGLTVVPAGGEARALAPLPLALLELATEQQELLARWGLRTIGDLACLPPSELAARLGPEGPRLVHRARGEDTGAFMAQPLPERFETTLELDWPVEGLEPLAFLLSRALEPLTSALAARGAKARALVFELGLADATTHARSLRPALPSGDARTWRTLVLLDLEARPPQDAITRLTLRAEPTPARAAQFSLLDPALPSPERLAETLARLDAWTAAGRSGSPQLVDTHRPGAFVVTSFAPPALPRGRRAPAPGAPRAALRAYRPPRLAHVLTKAGAPSFVSAPGVRGAVAAAAGPWRVSGDWWDEAFSREEWDVALVSQAEPGAPRGAAFRVFRDRLRGEWFVEGELD
jgi:protein ImuB